jgi:hypothetical protein
MAKRVKEKLLDSKDARQKLPVQGKPHWRSIERGLHLGYRRLKGRAGTWVARLYVGETGKPYVEEQIGIADDLSDADGIKILSYWQAVDLARGRMAARARTAAGVPAGPYTVKDAIDAHVEHLLLHKRTGRDVAWRAGCAYYAGAWLDRGRGTDDGADPQVARQTRIISCTHTHPARGGAAS